MNIDRRGFSKLAGAAALAPFAALAAGVARAEETLAQARARSHKAHETLAKREGLRMMGAKVQLVAKGPELKPVMSDTGLAIQPDAGFAEVPEAPTILFVPGAAGGLIDALRDAETIAFLEDRGARAGYVTSVCTGSLLLAAGGEGGRQRAAEGLDVVAEADRVLQRQAGALGEVLQHGMGGVAEQGDPALDPADDGIAVAEHPEPPALAVLDDLPGAPPDVREAATHLRHGDRPAGDGVLGGVVAGDDEVEDLPALQGIVHDVAPGSGPEGRRVPAQILGHAHGQFKLRIANGGKRGQGKRGQSHFSWRPRV